MKHEPKYKTLTPMRAFDLLAMLNSSYSEAWKLEQARESLSQHIKAALVRGKRRRRGAR